MTTARFFFGASLWALLIVDMCCGPVNRGFNPGESFGGSSLYPRSGSNQGVPSRQYSPGLMHEGASPELAASAGSGSSTRPLQPRGSAVREDPAGPAQSGAGFQSGSKESKLVNTPPIFEDEETPEVADNSEDNAGLLFQPVYQAGKLSQFEGAIDAGDYEYETQEQGVPPRYSGPEYDYTPLAESLEADTSPPLPPGPPGHWIIYPYYDYRFLTGQYPTGTVRYSSKSLEVGTNGYDEAHYVREYPSNSQPINTPMVKAPEVPQARANVGSRRVGAAKQNIYSGRAPRQPMRHAGGFGSRSNTLTYG